MANELTKPNDILVATLHAPTATTTDLLKNNINANNTSFLTFDEYKNTPLVLKAFTKDNVFDETAFTLAYRLAELKYHDLSDDLAFNNWEKELEYSATSIYRPLDSKVRNDQFVLKRLNNPLGASYSLEGINRVGQSKFTEEEAAQRNRIYDPKSGEWLNDTPESLTLLDKAFGKTLVYAKYDQDTEDPITHEIHRKGEWKKDADGNYYTEILDSEELLDKQVVALSDILTKEDSWLNKVDFFDSDGYDKSTAGIATKTVVSLIPWLIPGFNKYYGAMTAAVGLASVMPTFYKSLEHIFTGEEETYSSKAATLMENWFRKFESGKSRRGREGFWNLESIAQLSTDIFAQLYLQRAAASLAEYFSTNAKQQTELGLRLSLAYMGLISANDVYNDALQGGYDKQTAGIASIASAAALFGIMNFNETTRGIGTWFLDKTTGASQELARGPINKVAKSLLPEIQVGVDEFKRTGNKKVIGQALAEFKVKARSAIQDVLVFPTESIWKAAIVEGVEEVSEEVIQDMVKGMVDTMSWFGYTGSQGSFGGWENVFSQQGLERYLATLVGGGLGGAMFHFNMDHIEPFIKSLNSEGTIAKKREWDIWDVFASGLGDLLIQELHSLRPVLNNKFAPTQLTLENGTVVGQLGTPGQTQADLIIDAAIKEVQILKSIYDKVVPKNANIQEQLLGLAMFSQLKEGAFDKIITNDFKDACKKAAETQRKLDDLLSKEGADKSEQKELESLLAELVQDINDFFTGKNNIKYAMQAGILFNKEIRQAFTNIDLTTWLEDVKGIKVKDYNSNSELRAKLDAEYKTWLEDLGGDDASKSSLRTLETLIPLLHSIGPNFVKYSSSKHKNAFLRKAFSTLTSEEALEAEKLRIAKEVQEDKSIPEDLKEAIFLARLDEITANYLLESRPNSLLLMIQTNPDAFSLSDYDGFDLASELINKGIITINKEFAGNKDIVEVLKTLINNVAIESRLNIWNKESIRHLINQEVSSKLSENTVYKKKIDELLAEQNKGKKELPDALLSVSAERAVVFNEDAEINSDIEFIKINNILQYVSKAGLDEDNFRVLENAYKNKIKALLAKLPQDIVGDATIDNLAEVTDLIRAHSTKALQEYGMEPEEVSPIIDQLLKVIEDYNTLLKTPQLQNPIKEAIKKLHFILGGEKADLFDVLDQQELLLKDPSTLGSYSILSDLQNFLQSAYKTIQIIRGAVSATIKRSDGGGITELARNYADLYGDSSFEGSLPVLYKNDAEYIMRYLDNILNKIVDLQLIHDLNVRDLTEQDEDARRAHVESLAAYYRTKPITLNINGKSLNLIPKEILSLDLPDDQFIDRVEEYISSTLVREVRAGHTDAVLDALLEAFGEDVADIDYDAEHAVRFVDKAKKDLDAKNNFIVRRLWSLTHYSPIAFKKDLDAIYTENPNAFPSFILEFGLRYALSYLHNRDLELKLIDRMPLPEGRGFIPKVLMDHTMTVLGSGGAGKTYMLGLLKSKLLSNFDSVIVAAKEQVKLDALKTTVLQDAATPNAKLLTTLFGDANLGKAKVIEDGISKAIPLIHKNRSASGRFYSDTTLDIEHLATGVYLITIKGDSESLKAFVHLDETTGAFRGANVEEETLKKFDTVIDKNTAIVIDEATFLSPILSLVLNYLASNLGSLVIQVGDLTQMGFTFSQGDTKISCNAELIFGINLPILSGSFRLENDGKRHNLEDILKTALTLYPVTSPNPENVTTEESLPVVTLYKDGDFDTISGQKLKRFLRDHPLWYKDGPSGLMGDMITSSLEEFDSYLDKILKSEGDVIFVIDSEDSRKELVAKVGSDKKIVTLDQVQGDEADYVIEYKVKGYPLDNNADVTTKMASMLVGRSRKFGLYFEPDESGIFSCLGMASVVAPQILRLAKNDYAPNNTGRREQLQNEIANYESHPIADVEVEPNTPVPTEPLYNGEQSEADTAHAEVEQEVVPEPNTKEAEILQEKQEGVSDEQNVKVFQDADGQGVSIVHAFYTRLHLTRENAKKLETLDARSLPKFLEEHPDSEPAIFYNNWEKLSGAFTELFGGKSKTTITGLGLLELLLKFKDGVFINAISSDRTFAIIAEKYDRTLDWAYNKPNDFDPEATIYLRLVYCIDADTFITLGRLGYNDEDDPRFCKIQDDLYKECLNSNGTRIVKRFVYTGEGDDRIHLYINNRGLTGKVIPHGFLLRYTNLRDYSLSDDPEIQRRNQELFGEDGIDRFGRITWQGLRKLGISISNQSRSGQIVKDFKNPKEFTDWYNSFRLEPLLNTAWIDKMYKRKWLIASIDGTDFEFPILVNLTLPTFLPHKNPNGNIKLYSVHKMLQGLAQLSGHAEIFVGVPYNPKTPGEYTLLELALDNLKTNLTNAGMLTSAIEKELDSIIPILQKTKAFPESSLASILDVVKSAELLSYFFEDPALVSDFDLSSKDTLNNVRFFRIFERPRFYLIYDSVKFLDDVQSVAQTTIAEANLTNNDPLETVKSEQDLVTEALNYLSNPDNLKQSANNVDEIIKLFNLLYSNIGLLNSLVVTGDNKLTYLKALQSLAIRCVRDSRLKEISKKIADIRNAINKNC